MVHISVRASVIVVRITSVRAGRWECEGKWLKISPSGTGEGQKAPCHTLVNIILTFYCDGRALEVVSVRRSPFFDRKLPGEE